MTIENTEDLQQAVEQIAADIQTLNERIEEVNSIFEAGVFQSLTVQDGIVRTPNSELRHDSVSDCWQFSNGESALYSAAHFQKGSAGGVIRANNVVTFKNSAASLSRCIKIKTAVKAGSNNLVHLELKGATHTTSNLHSLSIKGFNAGNGVFRNACWHVHAGDLGENGVWAGYDDDDYLCLFLGFGVNKFYLYLCLNVMVLNGNVVISDLLDKSKWMIEAMQVDGMPDLGTWTAASEIYSGVVSIPSSN